MIECRNVKVVGVRNRKTWRECVNIDMNRQYSGICGGTSYRGKCLTLT